MRGGKWHQGRHISLGDIKQAREDQAVTTGKMLWTNSTVKCCNPELQKFKGTLAPCVKEAWRM